MTDINKEQFSFSGTESGIKKLAPRYMNLQVNLVDEDFISDGLEVDAYYGENLDPETFVLESSKKSFKILNSNVTRIEIRNAPKEGSKTIETIQW